jgi:hypothetical protein
MYETRINEILLQRKLKQGYDKKNLLKIGVEQIKDNEEFYLYLYL